MPQSPPPEVSPEQLTDGFYWLVREHWKIVDETPVKQSPDVDLIEIDGRAVRYFGSEVSDSIEEITSRRVCRFYGPLEIDLSALHNTQ